MNKQLKLAAAAILLAVTTTKAQVYFSTNAGINYGNLIFKISNEKAKEIKPNVGFILSADVNIPVSTHLMVQTGLQFENITNKVDAEETAIIFGGVIRTDRQKGKGSINFLNIPVKLFFVRELTKSSFKIGAGPFIGIGLSGKSSSTSTTTYSDNTPSTEFKNSSTTKFGNDPGQLKRINVGLGTSFVYTLASNVSLGIFTNIGFTNLNNTPTYSSKTYTIGLTAGYVFNNKKK
jgi:hypothetical protein